MLDIRNSGGSKESVQDLPGLLSATSIILGHNHPSGNIQPSEADNKITKKIRDCDVMLDVAVLDHIIIGDDRYYSFADEGYL